jgi:class I fructose-bisphosphate aldolase
MVILPVDQASSTAGRSFAINPPAYNPFYHFELAIEAGLSAYAAPLGFLEAGAADFAGELPLILKCNNHDLLHKEKDPLPAMTSGVDDALRLGCVAVGYTIYPGSDHRVGMYEQLRELIADARAAGLASVVWSYPRGADLSKEGETAIDVSAYAAQIAAQLGAHVIKVKLPSAHLEQPEAKAVYEQNKVPIATAAERVRHVVQSAFDGRRIVLC